VYLVSKLRPLDLTGNEPPLELLGALALLLELGLQSIPLRQQLLASLAQFLPLRRQAGQTAGRGTGGRAGSAYLAGGKAADLSGQLGVDAQQLLFAFGCRPLTHRPST